MPPIPSDFSGSASPGVDPKHDIDSIAGPCTESPSQRALRTAHWHTPMGVPGFSHPPDGQSPATHPAWLGITISLDRNYSTKRAELQHHIPGRRSGTGDILVAATAILHGLTIVEGDKRVKPGEA